MDEGDGEDEGKDDRAHPASDEALPGLVGRESEEGPLGELAPEAHATEVGARVVADDERHGEEEPGQGQGEG